MADDAALLKLITEQQRAIERLTAMLERMSPAAGSPEAPAKGPTFGDVHARYQKVKAASSPRWKTFRLKFVAKYFGKRRIAEIDAEAWAQYTTARMTGAFTEGRTASLTTVNVELAYTKALLTWAADQGLIPVNRLAKSKKARAISRGQGALREEHLHLVLDAAPNQMARAYILLGFDTGLRRFELLGLKWSDIDFSGCLVHVRSGKGYRARTVVATRRALDKVSSLPRARDDDPIFMNPETRIAYHLVSVNDWVRTAMIDSDVERFYDGKKIRIHALRHGHATNALEAGVPLSHVKDQLGHAQIATTEKYVHDRLDRRRESMASKYEAKLTGRRGPHRANHEIDVEQAGQKKIVGRP